MRGERILLLLFAGLLQTISTATLSTLHAAEVRGPGIVPTQFAQPFRGQCSAEFSYEVTFTAETAGEALASVTIFPVENVEEPGLVIDFFCQTQLAAGEVVRIPVTGILIDLTQEGKVEVGVLACDPDGELQETVTIETRIVACNFLCEPGLTNCPQGIPVRVDSIPTLSVAGLLALILLLSIAAVILLR